MARFRAETGAAAVELALCISVLLLMLFGITQFGLAYHTHEAAQAAAREGARIASFPRSTSTQVRERVRQALPIATGSTEACPPAVGQTCTQIVPASTQPCAGRSGQNVQVTVSRRVRIQIPLWASPEVTVSGKGDFRCE